MAADRRSSTIVASPDENNLFLDVLHEAPLFGQQKPTSILGSIFYCILLAGYAILAAGASWFFRTRLGLVSPLLCSADVILLVVTGTCLAYFSNTLSTKSRKYGYRYTTRRSEGEMLDNCWKSKQGYYVFSQKLKQIIRVPFAIIAYGTAVMLLIIVWRPHVSFLSISTILRIIMLSEVVCGGFFISVYIGNVHQYNKLDFQPDVFKSLYSPIQPSSSVEGLRYHEGGRLSDQQMALLQYQRENIHFLSEEILRLQECLSKYERSNDGSTPQVDLAYLLATRDQELRTVSAEMNQLQSELSLARSLIAERDSEIQHVRSTNNQYIEENERLRAILGEWSTRAAKLERALEVERVTNLELQKKSGTTKSQTREPIEPS